MSYVTPPVSDHVELTPEEVNNYRSVVVEEVRSLGIDKGVTTCVVLTLYRGDRKWQELRGTTNPSLYRFRAVIVKNLARALTFDSDSFRPPYDERRANRRAKG